MRAALVVLVVPAVAHGDREAQDAFSVGLQAYRANQFATAARSFEEAYARDPRPETAFSIAQANRRQYYTDRVAWRVQRAVQLYQAYLDALPAGPRAKDAQDRLAELEPILREVRQRGELTPYVAPIRTELVIGAAVETASVSIDGIATLLWTPVTVTPGVHDVVVAAPGFEPARRRVQVAEGRFLPIDIALVAKPGRLAIRGDRDALLYVDGRRLGSLPETAAVPAGRHLVSVTRRGRRTWSRELAIERGEDVTLTAALEPTTQRRAAGWVLLGAGGVAAIAGGAGLAAYTAHRQASDLDDRRRALAATPADLRAYNERVAAADRRRDLAIGVGLGAAVVGLVGASLWWFDRPEPGAPSAPGTRPVITPTVSSEAIGISLGFTR